MCGIVGQARGDGTAVDRALIDRMCAAQEHRGPDSRGVHTGPGVGLGIQRLRVIDLATGDQPIYNEDRSVVVVLNGEIYNFRELREQLIGRGHTFATRSDTEVIVHLYEERGPDCIADLDGMFGLAIWDERRRRLILARDRVGKKPLYYAVLNGELTFASELGALLQHAGLPRRLDPAALDAYMAFRYVPAPRSIFRDVRKLPPAHVLTFSEGVTDVRRYWELDFATKAEYGSEREVDETLRDALRRAVGKRMIADVPLGAFLSGGVDSAAVVAAMAEHSSRPVSTFSIGFKDKTLDELPLARTVAERFGTEHHELVIEPEAVEIIPRILRHHGEPFADATAIPTFYLAEMARSEVTVALNGDGGDEAFGGYTRYVAQMLAGRMDRVPPGLRGAIGALARSIPPSPAVNSTRSRLRRLGATLALAPDDRYLAYMTDLQGLRRADIYTEEFAEQVDPRTTAAFVTDPWHASSATTHLDRMLDVDTQHYLPDDLLTKVDIATMASSLEGRSPMLDHEFLQFAASLPPGQKVRGTEKKVALRRAMRGWVPDEILDAPKRGFQPPIAGWFRDELRGYAREVLLDPRTVERGYFVREGVETLLTEHAEGRGDHSQGIWTLLMLELWHREFVDQGAPATPTR